MTDKEIKEHTQVIKLALIAQGVTRMANYMEEILHLVKADQERSRKYMEEKKDEQETRLGEYPGPPEPLAMAPGPGTKLQATSCKRQAASLTRLNYNVIVSYKLKEKVNNEN